MATQKLTLNFLKCFLEGDIILTEKCQVKYGWSPIYDSINITSMEATET